MAIDYMSLGARVKFLRTQKNLTQEELAEKADIGRKHVSNIENGERGLSIDVLIALANALEVSADEILVDNLTASENNHDGDDYYLLLDCTPEEADILIKSMKDLKEALRKYKIQ